MNNNSFQVHAYGLQELALKYFPNNAPASASSQLKRWIRDNVKLYQDILRAGYHQGQRLLTPRQVEVIIYYLGEP